MKCFLSYLRNQSQMLIKLLLYIISSHPSNAIGPKKIVNKFLPVKREDMLKLTFDVSLNRYFKVSRKKQINEI